MRRKIRVADSDTPLWRGEPLAGKHIQIVGEQGIGEQIIFSTMIPDLIRDGAIVTFEVEQRLAPLYARSCPNMTVVPLTVPPHPLIENTKFDYKTAVGSIGRWYRTSVDSFHPERKILSADPALQAECRARYGEFVIEAISQIK